MTNDKTLPTVKDRIGDVAPKVVDLSEKVLFGDIMGEQRPVQARSKRHHG
jgi:hypothetical protein